MLGSASVWAIDPTVKELRIGFQKSSINFAIAKQQKLYEKEFPNAKITWNEFPAGPQILEALCCRFVGCWCHWRYPTSICPSRE